MSIQKIQVENTQYIFPFNLCGNRIEFIVPNLLSCALSQFTVPYLPEGNQV